MNITLPIVIGYSNKYPYNMNILLINPLLTQRKPTSHNIGLSYIGAVLLKAGYEVELYDLEAFKYSEEEVKNKLRSTDADIICIGTLVTGFNYIRWLCAEIKNIKPDLPIILGNSIATTIPELVLKNITVDYLVIGEGEITILELIDAIKGNKPFSEVDGIAYIENNEIVFTKPRELIQDLDTIPYPAWHLFPLKEIYLKNKNPGSVLKRPIGDVSSTRGCPYNCTFCYHPFQNKKVRMHSGKRVIEEIKFLVENYNIRSIGFADDLFTLKKNRVYEICDLMDKENVKIKWRAACRVNLISEDLLKRMKKSGCVELGIGVESGSQIILDNIKKQTTVQQGEKALALCKKLNIHARTSYMIGNVGETRETVFETVRFRKKYDPGMGGFFYATPYPDTELYRYAVSNNLIKDELSLIELYGEQSEKILVNFTNMTNNELEQLKRDANKAIIKNYCMKYPIQGLYKVGKVVLKL